MTLPQPLTRSQPQDLRGTGSTVHREPCKAGALMSGEVPTHRRGQGLRGAPQSPGQPEHPSQAPKPLPVAGHLQHLPLSLTSARCSFKGPVLGSPVLGPPASPPWHTAPSGVRMAVWAVQAAACLQVSALQQQNPDGSPRRRRTPEAHQPRGAVSRWRVTSWQVLAHLAGAVTEPLACEHTQTSALAGHTGVGARLRAPGRG